MLSLPGTEVDWRRVPVAALTPQVGEDITECPIAVALGQQARWRKRRSLAALHLQPTARPVGQAMVEAE
jgi:hypothetical protein